MKAIEAYQEALKIRTPETHPLGYYMLQKAIGDAYYKLSLIEDKEENLSKALEAYNKFLEIEAQIHGYTYIQTVCQEVKNKIGWLERERKK